MTTAPRRRDPATPIPIPGQGARVWGYGGLATTILLMGLTMPLIYGAPALPWTMGFLLGAGVFACLSWSHAILRVASNRDGMIIRFPDELFGLPHPPAREVRFRWEEVQAIAMMEGPQPGASASQRAWGAEGVLLITLRHKPTVRLTTALVGTRLLDIAELVAVATNRVVQGSRGSFAPGGLLGLAAFPDDNGEDTTD